MKRIAFQLFLISTSFVAMGAYSPTKAEREEMAKFHDEMASCLRSEKSIQDCHQMMRAHHASNHERCRKMFDAKDCPFDNAAPGKGRMMGPKNSPNNNTK